MARAALHHTTLFSTRSGGSPATNTSLVERMAAAPLLIWFLLFCVPLLASAAATSDTNQQVLSHVLNGPLESCSKAPLTGYLRDGFCRTDANDHGTHVVCAQMSQKFLDFTKSRGNDLSTPVPQYNFPGLQPGDKWCLCALRWKEALNHGSAPRVHLKSTHAKALEYVSSGTLLNNAVEDL